MAESSNEARLGRLWLLAALLAGVSSAAMAAPAPAPDPRDAKIDQLEAEVQQLIAAHQQLQAQDDQLVAKAQALEAELDALKAGQAAQTQQIATLEAKPTPPPPSAIAKIADGHPVIASADGRFTAAVHAIMQFDAAAYFQGAAGPTSTDLRRDGPALGSTAASVDAAHARDLKDGDDFRRARLGVDGTAFGDWDYRLILEFAGTGVENTGQLYETWIQYSGLKPLHFRVGAFPASIGLEDQGSTSAMPFMERSVAGDLSRGLAAGDTRSAAEVWASGDHWLVSGAVTGRVIGVLNTGTAAAVPQSFGDQLGLVGRIAGTPFYGEDWMVHFGVHGSYVVHPTNVGGPSAAGTMPITDYLISLSNTPELRVDGTKFLNTGSIDASHADTVGLEFAAQKAGLLIQSEYEDFGVQRTDIASNPNFHGYYVEAVWDITGEQRHYNTQTAAFDAPPVPHPFSLTGGGIGVWELGLRWSDMDLNFDAGALGTAPSATAIRGGEEQNVTLGLNWYANSMVRFMFDYDHVRIARLSPNAATFATPTGAQIGQSYDAVALRSQFAF